MKMKKCSLKKSFNTLTIASIAMVTYVSCKKTGSTVNDVAIQEPVSVQNINATQAVVANVSVLPKYLAFGLRNGPGQINLIKDLKVNYRYQYLSGGVNTSSNWKTWNTPSGDFARLYLNDSEANGFIPVFTYYQIIGSNPKPYTEPPFENLNNTGTMKSYFEDYKLLLQKCKDFGKPVIIHIEPDLFAFMQSKNGDDPTKTTVSVASSGYADAASFANNAKGFAQCLVSLRDKYAGNVILGWHASGWATNVSLTENNGDGNVLGERVVNFYKALGANFDLIFMDPSDRDAGYYEVVKNDRNKAWDADDFKRFNVYTKKIHDGTGLNIMLWQVPCGNTLYKSCNNTSGHYKDNRPQYYLKKVLDSNKIGNIKPVANAGVIAILFGKGQNDQTDYFDSKGDGITNSGTNPRNAINADDDGGFLRTAIKKYYINNLLYTRPN
jgi:hypothetical protein